MKKLLFAVLILTALNSNAQYKCWDGQGAFDKSSLGIPVTPAIIIDDSFRYFGPDGFGGFGLHMGAWIGCFGVTLGGVEAKLNDDSKVVRSGVVTFYGKYYFMKKNKILASPFIAIGTDRYKDIGLRLDYKVYKGAYIGFTGSRMMHYGLNVILDFK